MSIKSINEIGNYEIENLKFPFVIMLSGKERHLYRYRLTDKLSRKIKEDKSVKGLQDFEFEGTEDIFFVIFNSDEKLYDKDYVDKKIEAFKVLIDFLDNIEKNNLYNQIKQIKGINHEKILSLLNESYSFLTKDKLFEEYFKGPYFDRTVGAKELEKTYDSWLTNRLNNHILKHTKNSGNQTKSNQTKNIKI